ncbi:hypothetical protein SAMN05421839_10823 [Halolactibacillus halophilus]|uniref:DUF6884 domain-containing protein n=1 Tax=Halolactibacillus halophilus TaxID=306540 RepID=A0A1I5N7V5_9BACI|nr:DUF6884 domain-containing protein [Halolactibacillus halophilus]GEM01195.1 hypothetical protein HHA03_07270 [Halolactibacillus halophilus]SFP17928.1 hypothetical protein SAMN05421839_10823 [Halolactibacillus halophilus]
MRVLAVLPCGKRKIWNQTPDVGPMKVKDVYIGTLHRLTRQYAEIFADEWVILSGKHGFCSKDEMINEDYDITFGMKEADVISLHQLKQQLYHQGLDQYDRAIILTGKKHQRVIEAIGGITSDDRFPLLGTKGIGEMQQRLKWAIENKTPLD